MYCPNCGAKLGDGQKFCSECGTDLAALFDEPAIIEEPDASEPEVHVPDVTISLIDLDAPAPMVAQPSDTAPQIADASTEATRAMPAPVDATMVQPRPVPPAPVQMPQQSAVSTPPTDGASYYAQPPAAATGVPANAAPMPANSATTPQKRPWYAATWVKVALGALAMAAVTRIAVTAAGLLFRDDEPAYISPHVTVEPADPNSEGNQLEDITQLIEDVQQQVSVDDGQDTPTASAQPTVDADTYLEAHGYPTLLAYMELTGQELADLVTANGYFFYEGDETSVYAKTDGSLVFNVITKDGYLNESRMAYLSRGGHDERAVYVTVLEGFASAEDALSGVANCVVEKTKQVGEGEVLALVYGPSMERYLVDVYDVEDGDFELDLYSPEAVELGIFDVVKDGSFGSTPEEAFESYNG